MIHVLKRSTSPLSLAQYIRAGGRNTVAPRVREPFLILWSAQVLRVSEGTWEYLLDFEPRHSLQVSDLGTLVGTDVGSQYAADIDWTALLASDWEVIDEQRREQVLKAQAVAGGDKVRITNIRPGNRTPS